MTLCSAPVYFRLSSINTIFPCYFNSFFILYHYKNHLYLIFTDGEISMSGKRFKSIIPKR
jgi:hypothetical protein